MVAQNRSESIQSPPQVRPFTGAEYLESLKGRTRGLHLRRAGARPDADPAFRNAGRMLVRLYDALHDPARREVLTVPTDTATAASPIASTAPISTTSMAGGLPI